ncbi:MAG TPA: hypothetical protein VFR31_05335 [Thermoanaerobaculia bacterium]|nr:hypothetical protein [Thermoanaerobaculia bacterium]
MQTNNQPLDIGAAEDLIAKYEELQKQLPSDGVEQLWDKHTLITFGLGILVFGILITAMMAFLLYKNKSPEFVLRTFSIPLIIIAALFLITVGWSKEQMAPVIGLFGTIAGYILGRTDLEAIREATQRKPKGRKDEQKPAADEVKAE